MMKVHAQDSVRARRRSRVSKVGWPWGWILACLWAALPTSAANGDLRLDLRHSGERLELGVPAGTGEVFAVETADTLEALLDSWRSVATVATTDQTVYVNDPVCSTRGQAFYRLRLLEGLVSKDVPNFRLLDVEGRAHELFYHWEAAAVVLVLAGDNLESLQLQQAELDRLRALQTSRVRHFILTTRSDPAQRERARQTVGTGFPGWTVLEDEGGVVSRQLGSGTTPEVLVLDTARWTRAYRGQLADMWDDHRRGWAEDALVAVLNSRPVVVRETRVSGEALPPGPDPAEYSKDVAPLLQAHCVRCHSPGNIAPWAMTRHADIQERAALIKDEILTRRMPPWHADPHGAALANNELIAPLDLARLVDWLDRGAPRGEGNDPLADEVPPPPADWPLGTPDHILRTRSYSLPASGIIDYKYEIAISPFPTNVWLRAAVVKPGNRRAVHHVLVFSGGFAELTALQGGLAGYFAAFVPGQAQDPFPEGTGKLLKAGDLMVWQLHYTATGQPETDRTELGLYLHPTPPNRELRTTAAFDTSFVIPPGARDHAITADHVLQQDVVLYEMSPHMHYRGNRFRFDVIWPDQRRETLVNVPYYRFDWQSLYRLKEPLRLPAGTRIVCDGGWDNSPANPYNPDPGQAVSFGEQSWEEMFIGYFNYAVDR